ncbi:MAG: histidine phosphatase family protein [Ideonella sp. MAG2]|nr:MAG: histidine phosphatase family protein [Ideonella sp. MAG2]
MAKIYLVRHGQASFGAADYDQLSPLGAQQCELLGQHWRALGLRFDAVWMGSLKRHRQSMEAIAAGLGGLPTAQVRPGLNEYDPEALVRAAHPGPLPQGTSPEVQRQHFLHLRRGLLGWIKAELAPVGLPSHAEFLAGVMAVLDEARQDQTAEHILVLSSGGPISNAVGQLLQAGPEGVVELNLRLRNSAVSELHSTARRHALLSFNGLPHLDQPGRQNLQTYA